MKSKYPLILTLLFALAAALLLTLLLMIRANVVDHRPVFGLATLIILAFLALISGSTAIAALLRMRGEGDFEVSSFFKSYHHVLRLSLVLISAVSLAAIARAALVPRSYGDYGYYRGNAVQELANIKTPVHQGMKTCAECHEDVAALHDKDVHVSVQCENCHGPGDKHVALMNGNPKEGAPKQIAVPKTKDICLSCHLRLAARPASFPQIDPKAHYAMLGVLKEDTLCTACHSPHEPLFLDTKLSEARRHPMIQPCANCHRDAVDPHAALPEKHPIVFRCDYCHGELAADFANRAHAKFDCGVCHQFYYESETAGRIVKHRDPRFCLLCHENRPFVKDPNRPAISWPSHRTDAGAGPQDAEKVCADCHREAFHKAFIATGPGPKEGDKQ